MAFEIEPVESVVRVIESRGDLRGRLRTAFGVALEDAVASIPRKVYMTVKEFAERMGWSKRHVENLIKAGCPLLGKVGLAGFRWNEQKNG